MALPTGPLKSHSGFGAGTEMHSPLTDDLGLVSELYRVYQRTACTGKSVSDSEIIKIPSSVFFRLRKLPFGPGCR